MTTTTLETPLPAAVRRRRVRVAYDRLLPGPDGGRRFSAAEVGKLHGIGRSTVERWTAEAIGWVGVYAEAECLRGLLP